MNRELKEALLQELHENSINYIETLQELWSGYGKICRYALKPSGNSIIVKEIDLKAKGSHPRGWNTQTSHQRKLRSYNIECNWYRDWAESCTDDCRIPKLLYMKSSEDSILLVLEDLDASGFPLRLEVSDRQIARLTLKWLANFHAKFLGNDPNGLWEEGTYWHLNTRKDEWDAMPEGILKTKSLVIAETLAEAKYQTIVHGDAKLANFCYSTDFQKVAAVDFQYVGGGCGIKDVAYFLSSCFESEELFDHANELLDYYFDELKKAIDDLDLRIDLESLEEEWRRLYPFAWADFCRFLEGWSPDHWKLHDYSREMTERVLNDCN